MDLSSFGIVESEIDEKSIVDQFIICSIIFLCLYNIILTAITNPMILNSNILLP